MITITCETCERQAEKHPYQVKKSKRHFCSRECWNKAPRRKPIEEKQEFVCSLCGLLLPKHEFKFYQGRNGDWEGTVRRSQCNKCTSDRRKNRYEANKQEEIENNLDLHQRKLADRDDKESLKWALKRRMGGWRKRHREISEEDFDLSVSWLLGLYSSQNGLCYYTGQKMVWRTAGVGKGRLPPNGLSLDRLDSTRGYTRGNVVFSTYKANMLKSNLSLDDFYKLCEDVLRTRKERLLERS